MATDPTAKRAYQVLTDEAPLGFGVFGTVYHGVERPSLAAVAVKVVVKDRLKPRELAATRREALMMRKVGAHRNVLQLLDIGEDPKHLFIVTPIASGGNLKRVLQGGMPVQEDAARELLRSLMCGIAHMHERGVMHRDIKLENILLAPKEGGDTDSLEHEELGSPVLIDLGFATDEPHPNAFCGTPYYIAPEIIRVGEARKGSYDNKCDVWSFGVVAYMLLQGGTRPFSGASTRACFERIRAATFTWDEHYASRDAHAFVRWVLQRDPEARPSALEVLQHPWLAKDNSAALASPRRRGARAPVSFPIAPHVVSAEALRHSDASVATASGLFEGSVVSAAGDSARFTPVLAASPDSDGAFFDDTAAASGETGGTLRLPAFDALLA